MAKPKLALIPAAQGDKFYSVLPSDGVGDFDFTRGSSATRINAQGLIQEVASGDSRLNYDLLNGKVVNCPHYLLEPARTNVMLQSNQFDTTWVFTRASVSQGYLSPDGSLNAWAFIDNTTDSTHLMVQSASLGAVTSTASIYAKAGTRDFIAFRFEGNTGVDYAYFDVKNGIIGDVNSDYIDVSMEDAGNGWYRCIATRVLAASGNQFIVLSADTNGDPTYAGNGDNALYIFGAQVEEGSYPTSYIPTNGTAITRAAESADGSGDAATFNDSEGVLMAEIAALANDGTYRQISINDSSTNNRITLDFTNTDNQIRSFISFNGTSQALMVGSTIATNQSKAAVSYKSNDFSLWLNGFKVDTDTNGSVPTGLNNLNFDNGGGANDFYGKTREVQYFDSALTDAQLETLTSWTSLQEMITSQLYTNY